MLGYWRDPEATSRVIVDGWLHTGDIACVDREGYLRIVDRSKDIIISGGENISSLEVENALYAHPAVLEAAVVGVPDARWGEIPKAFIVLKDASVPVTIEEITAHCKSLLAGFKVPRRVEFVTELPKSGTGKIMKSALRAKE